jgi:E3 ubiquitin-protein ligase TRIP12
VSNSILWGSGVAELRPHVHAQDAKVVENACLALSRIAEALSHSPQHLDMLCSSGLVSNAVQLVAVSDSGGMTAQLSMSTYYGLIKLLTTCAAGSHSVAESLLAARLSGTMRSLLTR